MVQSTDRSEDLSEAERERSDAGQPDPLSLNWGALSEFALALARALGAPPQRAHDIAQDAVLQLLGAGHVRHPRAWLRTVVRRLVMRIRGEPAERTLGEAQEELLEPLRRRPELSLDVLRTLARMRHADRVALLMCLAGFKQREIGRRMGWSEKSVGSRILRAQARARLLGDRM